MNIKSKFIIAIFTLFLVLSISVVSAEENITDESIASDDILNVEENLNDLTNDGNTDELSSGNTIYISPNGTGSGSSESDPTTWNNAMSKVASGDSIQFANGTYTDIEGDHVYNINLKGSGSTVIDANGTGGFFTTVGSVTLDSLSFINAYTGDKQGSPDGPDTQYDGEGAIINNGYLTVKNCYFASNQGIGTEGGAIHNSGTCYVYDSTFFRNGGKKGGAIYSDKNSYLYVYNSLFNKCVSREGSAVHAKEAYVEIHNSSVVNASAKNGLFYVKKSTVYFYDSYFYNSKAVDSAGVINIDKESNVYVDNCIFDKISSAGSKLWFHDEYGSGDGGVIVVEEEAKNVEIKNSIFTNCSAKGYGGVLYINSAASITIDNCTFKDNRAAYGNNIYGYNYASRLTIQNSKFDVVSSIQTTDIDYGETEYITVTLDDGTNNLLNPTFVLLLDNDDSYKVTSGNTISLTDVSKGNHTVTLTGNDYNSNVYTFTEPSAVFVVGGENIEVTVSYAVNSDGSINVKVVDEYGRNVANIGVTVSINKTDYAGTTDKNGIAVISPNLAEGEYDVSVVVEGRVISNKTETKIIISNSSTTPISDVVNVDFSYDDSGNINVEVTDEYGRIVSGIDVSITINGQTYSSKTDSRGIAVITPTGTVAGEYDVTVKVSGKNVSSTSPTTVKVLPSVAVSSIVASDLTRGYASAYDFKARFLDKNANPLKNKEIVFTVNGNDYFVITDEFGYALLANNFAPGTYSVLAQNPATAEQTSNSFTIVARIAENKDVNMDYSYSTFYKVRIFADNGNPVSAGENVVFKIDNQDPQIVKTDKNGYAVLNIKNKALTVKTHTITAEYKGFKVSNNLVVKQILKSKNFKFKTYKTKKLKATLKTSSGKVIKGKKITFKVKGKKYTAKTNKKGVATVKITKYLKPGKYKVKIKYLKNTIKKTLKIKR